MQIRQIDPDYSVSAQITSGDLAEVKAASFKSVICNRPDNEDPGQPGAAEIEQAAHASGLEFRHIPVISGQMTAADVEAQAKALDELPKPIFAYCRSGARCTNLYASVQESRRDRSESQQNL